MGDVPPKVCDEAMRASLRWRTPTTALDLVAEGSRPPVSAERARLGSP